jgi:hypothetical protein
MSPLATVKSQNEWTDSALLQLLRNGTKLTKKQALSCQFPLHHE